MAKGKIRSFDDARGFGFIKSNDADDDVFFHVRDVTDGSDDFPEGTWVEFELVEGDRGLKATGVTVQGGPKNAAAVRSGGASTGSKGSVPLDQYRREITELLLGAVDDLTGKQVRVLRDALTDYGFDRGFVVEGRARRD